jgi:hypothetical protein
MPLNYLDIRKQVEQFGDYVANHVEDRQEALTHLRELLEQYADQAKEINARINLTRESHQSLRCAAPVKDSLTQIFSAPEEEVQDIYLLASDGSQIFPDTHGVAEYGVVNIGLLSMRYHSSEHPEVIQESKLYYPGQLPFDGWELSEDAISFLRDIEERRLLSNQMLQVQQQHAFNNDGEMPEVFALTDGPLDLFSKPETSSKQARRLFDQYLDSLQTIQQRGGIVAGYIERPRASMVVRTLELMETAEEQLTKKGLLERQYPGISDVMLFAHLLKPGQRTGVFRLVSNSESNYSKRDPLLGLHFFYLNAGYLLRNGSPLNVFARVEIPAWVANDISKVSLVHQILLEQTKILGTNPYPYLLHRAHETAIVRFTEKEELDRMIISQLLAKGVEVDTSTQKSANKRSSGS